MSLKIVVVFLAVSVTAIFCNEEDSLAFWKGTILDSHIEKIRTACAEKDNIACFQYNAFKFLNGIIKKDYFGFRDNIEVKPNDYASNEVASRSYDNIEDSIEDYIKKHDITFKVPLIGDITVDSTDLDNEKIDIKWNLSSGRSLEARKKSKTKIKKILGPILIFLLLKAITLVPLALGVLGYKAWNSLTLSFMSFVISTGLAIFQLCQKLAADNVQPQIATSGPWESVGSTHWARNLNEEDTQKMAYSAYVQES
ncbi:uncharacterized protein LOC130444681 [Diorhabda sublineata]|uniref:uncharacterized protein LOC130444681 n=1 Tax=Diorhabda sublineata TaxID=1163346 RepID=UPI0024E10AC1|nr:uncharacterized protein LOC130444681 [Diorhabda sublineata]